MSHHEKNAGPFAVVAEFPNIDALLAAIHEAKKAGYSKLEAYTPFPSEDVIEALEIPPSKLPWAILAGGITGFASGMGMQYWMSVIDYPLNIGGRPIASIGYYGPVAYELTILLSALAAVFGMFTLCGLPSVYHPLFNWDRFKRATQDGFFMSIEATDPKFQEQDVIAWFKGHEAVDAVAVEH